MHCQLKLGVLFLCLINFIQSSYSITHDLATEITTNNVAVKVDNQIVFSSPKEGLWSIATDWENNWPSNWLHANPTRIESQGEWTILHGELKTQSGNWKLRDAYRLIQNRVECRRRFEWHGEKTLEQCTLSIRFDCPGKSRGAFMPGIIYYGNPSGSSDPKRVPTYWGKTGGEAIYEEHRFPMPFVSLEWQKQDSLYGAALHSIPSPVPCANLPDQWWSMGHIIKENETEFVLLSGPCATNGKRSTIKAKQRDFLPYPNAWLTVEPGAIIEKTVFLEGYPVQTEGSGFQQPIETSLDIFHPYSLDGLPTFKEILESKYQYAMTRWHETDQSAGFHKYPDRPFYVIGWCGQAMALGYAFQILNQYYNDNEINDKIKKSLDFMSNAKFYNEGFHTWYNHDTQEWSRIELLSQGQGMDNIANAIRVGRSKGLETKRWEEFLQKASTVHAKRILSDRWYPKSTNEGFFISPLCKAYQLFNEPIYLTAARKAGDHYGKRHLDMNEPYWGGTLDARCEDKEGAYAALQGFLALYEMTNEAKYLEWAKHACDVCLSYVVVWDIDLPPGRLRDHNFKTRGWTAVSPQNEHIDVFGVLIAPYIYKIGTLTEQDRLKQLAIVMYRTCGQLIDPYGSQGEQPQHTNYVQHDHGRYNTAEDVFLIRGDYVETWTVFWITAHFLNAAALFDEQGVDVWHN
jgi:hypothetical protein